MTAIDFLDAADTSLDEKKRRPKAEDFLDEEPNQLVSVPRATPVDQNVGGPLTPYQLATYRDSYISPYIARPDLVVSDGVHGDRWNAQQAQIRSDAVAAGLPDLADSRNQIMDSIDRVKRAGFRSPSFMGKPDEPDGDRAPTMDIENLVSALKAQEWTTHDLNERARIAKERAYWEKQVSEGMSAKQWHDQTGEPDPVYPAQVSSTPSIPFVPRVLGDVAAGISEMGSDVAGVGRAGLDLLASGFQPRPDDKLSPEWQQRYQSIADYLRSKASGIGEAQKVVREGYAGRDPSLDMRIAQGLGDTAATVLPGVGIPAFAAKVANDARDAYYAQAGDAGTSEGADEAAKTAVAKQLPILGGYALGAKGAGAVADRLLPDSAGALRQFLTRGGLGTAANVGVSSGVRALEGEGARPSIESFLTGDLPFGLIGAAHGSPRARVETSVTEPEQGAAPTQVQETPARDVSTTEALSGTRADATPVFSEGATPKERAANLLEPKEDQPLSTAARFAQDEEIPAELTERVTDGSLAQIDTANGERVVYDPLIHQAEDFKTTDTFIPPKPAQAPSEVIPQPEPDLTVYPKPSPRATVETDIERQARWEHEAELVGQFQQHQQRGGDELLDAVESGGGLPAKTSGKQYQFRGELENVRQAYRSPSRKERIAYAKIFRSDAPDIDRLTEHLRTRGFDVTTPSDTLELIRDRITTGRPVYGNEARGAARDFEPAYRRDTPPPRTPEQLLRQAKVFRRALRRLAPKTDIQLEVVKRAQLRHFGDVLDDVAAAHLDGIVYMVHEALNSGDTLNRVNFLHEVAHAFEPTLPESTRRQLRAQFEVERASRRGMFYDDQGRIPSYVDQRVTSEFVEWFAERIAWENHQWAKGEFDRANTTLIGRIAHDLRRLIQRVMGVLKPDAPPSELARQFRSWMAEGGRTEKGGTNVRFARRTSEPDMFAPQGREPVERRKRVEAEQFELPVSDQRRAPAPSEAPQFHGPATAEDITGLGLRPEEQGGQQVLFARRDQSDRIRDHGIASEVRWQEKQAGPSAKTAGAIREKASEANLAGLGSIEARGFARETLHRYADDIESGNAPPQSNTNFQFPIYRKATTHAMVEGAEHARKAAVDAQLETGITRDNVLFARRNASDVVNERTRQYRDELSARDKKEAVAYGYDAANTRATQLGERAGNAVRLDFGSKKELADPNSGAAMDDKAASLVLESGGKREEMERALELIRTSKDAKLAREFTPIAKHALAHFDRLKGMTGRAQEEMQRELAIERRAGMKVDEHQNYVTHQLEDSASEKELEPVLVGGNLSGGGGVSRYFAKHRSFQTLAEAIHEGYRPRSISLSDLTGRRVTTGQRVVQQRRFLREQEKVIADTKGPDGKRYIITKSEGNAVPPGYVSIDAAGQRIAVHRQYVGLFRALYGDSVLRNSALGRVALRTAAGIKHKVLFLDTYHVGRVFKKELGYGYQAGYNKGLSVLEYRDADLQRAVQRGDLTKQEAFYVRAMRPKVDELIRQGLNVGNVADNMAKELKTMLTDIRGTFNDWTFKKFTRGAMTQVALTNFERNLKRFPELTQEQVARKTAKETNEVFGNLQSQGVFKSKTMQDLSRLILLAPNWTESQLRAELRAYGQVARAPVDALRGKLRLGTVAQGAASIVVAHFVVNQLLNQIYRGQFTWQNDEDGHKLDAWIPGGKFGFWFNPFESTMEFTHAAMKYAARHESPLHIGLHIASNKLGPIGRSVKTLTTGRDYAGRPFASTTDRIRASLLDLVPAPIPLSSVFEKDPRKALGFRLNRQPGSIQKQALAMVGERVEPEESPQQKMFSIAHDYRDDKGYGFPASPYTELRKALANDQTETAKDEVRNLVSGLKAKDIHKKLDMAGKALGVRKDGTIAPEVFAQNKDREKEMLRNLTPAQRAIYRQAEAEHRANALKFKAIRRYLEGGLLSSGR